MVHGDSEVKSSDPIAVMRASYEKGVTDEFVIPAVITTQAAPGKPAAPRGVIRDDDAVIFFNFRADRARQITKALIEPGFDKIADPARPKNLAYVGMTQYEKTWPWLRYILAPEKLEHILANVFAELRIQKSARARKRRNTRTSPIFSTAAWKSRFPAKSACVVPSQKVATYDLKPEMSAAGVADTVIHAIEKGDFDAIIMNFANADMVGHSGKLEATIKAVETVDEQLGRIFQALRPRGGAWIITADHGNAETMIDPVTGGPHTYHTTNPGAVHARDRGRSPATRSPAARCAISRRRCWASWTWPSRAR